MSTLTFNNVSFSFNETTPILSDVTATFNAGTTGIVGRNGTGKSTLFRLILGELQPQAGTISASGNIGYLPQKLTLNASGIVADLFGAHDKLAALTRIEVGNTDIQDYDTLGDDWDIREQIQTALDSAGLKVTFDRKLSMLSGGETILCALLGLQHQSFNIVLLDEPTNNLDMDTKALLYEQIKKWKGTLLVISHDTELLELMDDTCELYNQQLTVYGGGYSLYKEVVATQQEKAEQAIKTAEQKVKQEKRQRVETEKKLANRNKTAKKASAEKRVPKIVANTLKSQAQNSAGKLRDQSQARLDTAKAGLEAESSKLRESSAIRIDLPDPQVPAHKVLAKLHSPLETIVLEGKTRVVLTGRNGVGKTRLLNSLFESSEDETNAEALTQRIGYVTQRLDNLSEDKSLLENIKEASSNALDNDIRAQLARFLFRGEQVDKLVQELSGGERFRLALAKLLLAEPAHQLLVLDEPSNNLDLDSIDELVSALENYQGALLVVTHDKALIEHLQPDIVAKLSEKGLVRL